MMAAAEIDAYFAAVEEPKRSTLEEMRRRILKVIPDAEQTMSYNMPAFKIDGKVIVGLAAFKHHLSYLPHSGTVFPELAEELRDYKYTKGSLHFDIDEPLPRPIIKMLIETRMRQAGL
jgi:uncharacterized protein YdhG (YjbR/CyaY superfamily)